MLNKGKFYFIFVLFGEGVVYILLQYVIDILYWLDIFIVECVKIVCCFIKVIDFVKFFSELIFYEIIKYMFLEDWQCFLADVEQGKDIGFFFEVGCLGVVDFGVIVV